MRKWYWFLGLIGIFAVGCQGNGRFSQSQIAAIPLPTPPVIDPNIIFTLLPPDSIPAIDDPHYDPVEQASRMQPDERVIGIEINGDARAYPINILGSHEIVNDVVGGEPVAITWCPLCYSALVFSRRVENIEEPLTFGVSGKLLQNTLVMFDRETDSLWSQLYGGAIEGPLAGTALSVFPSVLTTWEVWQAQNPNGKVLSKQQTCVQFNCGNYATNPRGSYDVDPYASYYAGAEAGVVNQQIPRDDFSAQPKRRVLGVRIAGVERAYPYDITATELVINDMMGGVPIVIWFDPTSQTGAAYLRTVNGRVLTFTADPQDTTILQDADSGGRWLGATGVGVNGRYAATPLQPIITTPAFEFGWFGYFPNSDVYLVE